MKKKTTPQPQLFANPADHPCETDSMLEESPVPTNGNGTQIAVFESESGEIAIRVDGSHDTVWATQDQIAELFGCTQENVAQHLKAIYATNEMDPEATNKKILLVRREGERDVSRSLDHYNLDAILSVGYRVSSRRATAFRQWATQTLSSVIRKGFVIDEQRIANDLSAQKDLAKIIRRIRTEEKVIYQAVRDVFKESSSDYDANSQAAHTFYATVQDKFHYAVSQKTAAQIKMERASAKRPNCGLVTFSGQIPTQVEAQVAKNYLNEEEVRGLENLCEQWLLYAESKAMRGQRMTMGELLQRVNQLLEFNGYPVMWEYPQSSNPKAAELHVKKEIAAYRSAIESRAKALQG